MRPRDSRLVRFGLGVFFLLLAGYALYEARGILYGPVITVPADTFTTHEERIFIEGSAKRIIELRLNGKTIPVTESGEFKEAFLVAEGINHLVLEANDARGRTVHKNLEILYIPAETTSNPSPSSPLAPTTASSTPED